MTQFMCHIICYQDYVYVHKYNVLTLINAYVVVNNLIKE